MHDQHATHLRGMVLCLAALLLFACQDAFTKVLARDFAVAQFLLVRFWAFAAFATVFAALRCGVGTAARSSRPMLQLVRCTIVVIEIGLFAYTLRHLGLAEVHAISATFPLIAPSFSNADSAASTRAGVARPCCRSGCARRALSPAARA